MATDCPTGTTVYRLLRAPDDAAAWREFVDRYGPRIFGWCRRWGLQQADAENVTQEVLTLLFRKLTSFDPAKGAFRGWLKMIARHAWSDYCDKQRRLGIGSGDSQALERLHTLEARDDLALTIEKTFDVELLQQAQAEVRSRVAEASWQAFQLMTAEGLSGVQTAARLNMKVAAVFTARCRVQKMLQDEVRRVEALANERLSEKGTGPLDLAS